MSTEDRVEDRAIEIAVSGEVKANNRLVEIQMDLASRGLPADNELRLAELDLAAWKAIRAALGVRS